MWGFQLNGRRLIWNAGNKIRLHTYYTEFWDDIFLACLVWHFTSYWMEMVGVLVMKSKYGETRLTPSYASLNLLFCRFDLINTSKRFLRCLISLSSFPYKVMQQQQKLPKRQQQRLETMKWTGANYWTGSKRWASKVSKYLKKKWPECTANLGACQKQV